MPDDLNKRATDKADSPVSPVANRRRDAMFCAAYLAIVCLVYLTAYEPNISQYAQGIITMVLGMFLNELKNMYGYEIGTTRSAATKDEAIKVLTSTGSSAPAPL